jgi:hypothetical protein
MGTHLIAEGGVFLEICGEDAARHRIPEVPVQLSREALEEPDVLPDHDLEGAEHVVLL